MQTATFIDICPSSSAIRADRGRGDTATAIFYGLFAALIFAGYAISIAPLFAGG
jgi:hypothetical protein